MSLLCHHSTPKLNSNSPEPELFHRLWLQLKSPAPAGSGSTTLAERNENRDRDYQNTKRSAAALEKRGDNDISTDRRKSLPSKEQKIKEIYLKDYDTYLQCFGSVFIEPGSGSGQKSQSGSRQIFLTD